MLELITESPKCQQFLLSLFIKTCTLCCFSLFIPVFNQPSWQLFSFVLNQAAKFSCLLWLFALNINLWQGLLSLISKNLICAHCSSPFTICYLHRVTIANSMMSYFFFLFLFFLFIFNSCWHTCDYFFLFSPNTQKKIINSYI